MSLLYRSEKTISGMKRIQIRRRYSPILWGHLVRIHCFTRQLRLFLPKSVDNSEKMVVIGDTPTVRPSFVPCDGGSWDKEQEGRNIRDGDEVVDTLLDFLQVTFLRINNGKLLRLIESETSTDFPCLHCVLRTPVL